MSQTKAQLISDLVQALNFTGTASAPSNGAFLSAANTLAFATNSAQRLTIDSSGRVVIGNTTVTDNAKFQQYGTSARYQSFQSTNGDLAIVTDNNSNPALYIKGTGTADLVNIFDNTTEVFTILDGGNVGIGETSPAANLHVKEGDSGTTPDSNRDTLFIENNGNSGLTIGTPNSNSGYLSFADPEDDNAGQIIYRHASNSMSLFTAGSERLRIDSSGRVGIGTTSPSAALEVINSSTGRSYSVSSATEFVIERDGNSQISIIAANSSDSIIHFGDTDDENIGLIGYDHANNSMRFRTNDSVHMTLDSSGKVGIGTTSPSAKLHVIEDIYAKGSSGDGSVGIQIRSGGSALSNQHQIRTGGGTGEQLFIEALGSSSALVTKVNGSERMRINSSGNVLVGTTSDSIYNDTSGSGFNIKAGGQLVLAKEATSSADPLVWLNDTGQTTNKAIVFAQDGSEKANIGLAGTAATITVAGSERMRIDSSGNVGIGTSSTSMNGNGLKIYHTNFPSLQLQNNATGTGATVGAEFILSSGGALQLVQRSAEAMIFKTTNLERMRINSSGTVGINNTGTNFGQLSVGMPSQSGGAALQVMNSASGSGDGGTTNIVLRSVNSIGNNWANAQYRAQSHQFQHQGTTKVNINSNGLCFNTDTAAANALDDYEEGTWTPNPTESGNNVSTSHATGRYVKIGAMVYAFWRIDVSTTSAGGHLIITGLPFTNSSTVPATGGFAADYQTYDVEDGPILHVPNSQSNIQFYKNSGQNFNANNASGKSFRGCTIFSTA